MNTAIRLAALAAAFALAGTAQAQVQLPPTISWSAYDVGSGGYNQAVAIGNALKQKYNVSLRVLPGKNDVSRNLPVREGQVQFSANGVGGAYLAQEGVFEFGAPSWGPQPIRGLMLNTSDQVLTVVAARDSGVRTVADLKGKRVAWVIGAPSLNQNITAMLAFANLTWNDVQKVEFGGFGAAMDGIINNQVDAAFTSSISGKAYQIAKSPRGLVYPIFPHSDKAGWARMQAMAPFFFPYMGTEGAELSKDKPAESATYPYPILMTYATQDAGLVYNMTKAMVETYSMYKDAAPGNSGWAVERQNFAWVIPFHDGAIRFWKENGQWKPEHQAHNDKLIGRQKVLAAAWAEVKKGSHADDKAFVAAWQKARAEALTKAGFDPVTQTW
ncbi:MAG: TAXI family TRAP transporter solute-binding subunit [Betaproteobacteria bacterium]|nr:TAXI family TRAP transporter solute-binding subunit [Betaproteobacteria bacterium]MDH5220637.1 TAXI family TRAP transporter solute-binding subunit [Betaproteobacteria bacterium]MDH5350555.1 TAXI family TRAP transporter solute-binding subunit [Betaproteobacteria bacterium]